MSKYIITVNRNLSHDGIKGMKWGRRRFQNKDGSLTEAGRKRYGVGIASNDKHELPKNSTGGLTNTHKMPENSTGGLYNKMSEIAKRNHEQLLNLEARRSAIRDGDHEAIEEIRKNTEKIDRAI